MFKISSFADKFMMVTSEKLRNFYMITFKFIFSEKYRKKSSVEHA